MVESISQELADKLKSAASEAEVVALGAENGVEFTADEAHAIFEYINGEGELSDDALGDVSGGFFSLLGFFFKR